MALTLCWPDYLNHTHTYYTLVPWESSSQDAMIDKCSPANSSIAPVQTQ